MTDTFQVVAQLNITSTGSLQTLYVVPVATSTTISSIFICNQNNSTIAFSVTVRSATNTDGYNGAGTDFYLYGGNVAGGMLLPGVNTFAATVGLTLAAGDTIKVQSDTTNVTFQLFGVQVT